MPNYGDIPGTSGSGAGSTGQAAVALDVGVAINLFNTETLTAPQASMAIAVVRAMGSAMVPALTFDIEFASGATDSLIIQGAMVDTPAAYQTLFTSSNKQQDLYTDTGNWLFYRANLASQSGGGALRVTARR